MNIFQQAAAGQPLTPGQRAVLKLLQSFALTALIAGLLAAGQYLAGDGAIDWQKFAFVVGGAAILALGHAVAKYFTAQGDQPLGDAIEAVVNQVEQRLATRYATRPVGTPTEAVGPVITSVYPVDQPSMPAHLASLSDIPDMASQETAKRPTV